MHSLLKRQIKRRLGITDASEIPEHLDHLFSDISLAYEEFESAQAMIEHTLEVTSTEVNERNQDIQKANTELERFAYVVSHDLQEPLRSVAGYTQLLKRRYGQNLDPKAISYIDGAVDGARRMKELINDLLEYSKIGFGKVQLIEISLEETVNEAMQNLRASIEESGATISIARTLPMVIGDKRLLQQLIQNIVSNALKFRSERTPEVTICAKQQDERWKISIADNGIGIPEREFKRVFDVFQRLHTRSEFRGTGIGLALCQRIAERHGSRIEVESEEGTGTTFSFSLDQSLKGRSL